MSQKRISRASVYLESSVVSYFANEISSDLKVAAEQRITKEWWASVLPSVEVYISDFVLGEIAKGKKSSAEMRLQCVKTFSLLPIVESVYSLSEAYIKKLSLPKSGEADAFHLAIATVHRLDFILSWNCKHIANAFKYPLINKINSSMGYPSPTICTPRELMEV